ncbi:hypothetical protein [Pyramidobacter sp. C12-8]|uniref:hypothetical protein n=1 Tax=Pyramidobacter sp. C12-8 TaxID=1943580 RepID=UPI00117A1CD5|nr:hypothetical protein [Pyramidobacter sp. C12-8]
MMKQAQKNTGLAQETKKSAEFPDMEGPSADSENKRKLKKAKESQRGQPKRTRETSKGQASNVYKKAGLQREGFSAAGRRFLNEDF